MTTTINNGWITLTEKKKGTTPENGITIQRASKALNTDWSEPDENGKSIVLSCVISYYQRELYPNGDVIKTELKTYKLEDLASQDVGETEYMEPMAVLSGFVAQLGQPAIVNKILSTLSNSTVLPIDAEDNYPLNRDTRPKLPK